MVKHPSKDRGCLLWTAAELAGFPGDILDVHPRSLRSDSVC